MAFEKIAKSFEFLHKFQTSLTFPVFLDLWPFISLPAYAQRCCQVPWSFLLFLAATLVVTCFIFRALQKITFKKRYFAPVKPDHPKIASTYHQIQQHVR